LAQFSQIERGFGPVMAQLGKEKRKLWAGNRSTRFKSTSGLVGAGRFERPTPCAQGGFRPRAKVPYFQQLLFQ